MIQQFATAWRCSACRTAGVVRYPVSTACPQVWDAVLGREKRSPGCHAEHADHYVSVEINAEALPQ